MPAVVQLKAADIKIAVAIRQLGGHEILSLGGTVEPMALARLIDRPWPGFQPPIAPAPGFGAGQGLQDSERHAGLIGGNLGGLIAERCGIGPKRQGQQCQQGQHQGPQQERQHGSDSPKQDCPEIRVRIFPIR